VNGGRRGGRSFQLDPRLIAPLAFILAATAIALELVYTLGHFVLARVP
jgi:hypothetical protein